MADEVTVTTEREPFQKRPRPNGLSPIQAGLLYGGAGAALGGPFGLLAGVFAGITSKRLRDNYLDRIARDMGNLRGEYAGLQDEIKSELAIADPDEARLLESAQRTAADGWYRLQSGDETGRAMIEQANEMIRGVMNQDIQARKAEQASQYNAQRGLITNAATTFRDQYSATISQARDIDKISQRILSLTSDPNFDPNKPINRTVLSDLVSAGMGMFRDNPSGFLDGLAAGGQGTIVGALAQGIDVFMDEEKFNVTKEDYNKLALNARQVALQYAEQRLGEIKQQSVGLDDFARKVGVIPQDYSLGDYVSGGVESIHINPAVEVPTIRTETKQPSAATRTNQWKQQSSGPPRRNRAQVTEPELAPIGSDDWFRQKLGIPTQSRRRPTN